MASEETISQAETQGVVELVQAYCPDQGATSGTAAAWAHQFNHVGLGFTDAVRAVHSFAASETFASRSFRRIDHVDVIRSWRSRRREVTRTLVMPAPNNPDDPQAYIAHQRAMRDAVTSDPMSPVGALPPGRQEASERRVRALRESGAVVVSRSNPPRAEVETGIRELMVQARHACSKASRSSAEREGREPPQPAPVGQRKGMVGYGSPPGGTTSLAGALSEQFPGQATASNGKPPESWCGTCHQDTGVTVVLDGDGSQRAVACCAEQRSAS